MSMSMSMSMSSLDDALVYATLKRDVTYIVELFMSECNHEIDPSMFMMSRGSYSSPDVMYADIMRIVGEIGLGAELLEMMPFIDDYLEFYFS